MPGKITIEYRLCIFYRPDVQHIHIYKFAIKIIAHAVRYVLFVYPPNHQIVSARHWIYCASCSETLTFPLRYSVNLLIRIRAQRVTNIFRKFVCLARADNVYLRTRPLYKI